jgi:predicted ribosomally synthesized peptide with SipW-like signal peptide
VKRKIAMLVIGAMLAVALVGGGVYAYFSDTETSSGNGATAGTLDLELNDGVAKVVTFSNVKPGDSGADNFKVHNIGTVNGELSVAISSIVNGPGSTPEPEPTPDNGELGANMNVVFWVDTNNNKLLDAGEDELYSGTMNGATLPADTMPLDADAETYIGFSWSIPTTVGNEIQGDTVSFSIDFTLNQA